MNLRGALSTAIIVLAIAIGAVRDFLFVNLNYQLDHLENHRVVSYAHSMFQQWSASVDAPGLRVTKWALAGVFIVINLLLAVLLSRVRFSDHRYRKAIAVGFGVVCGIALFAQILSGSIPVLATVAVKLLHTLQYPVLLLLIWAASSLVEGQQPEHRLP